MNRVVVADPGHQVPAYDRALAGALAAEGIAVTLATAPPLNYDPGPAPSGVEMSWPFGRRLVRPDGTPTGLARRSAGRRALRLAGYPAELVAFTRRLSAHPPAVLHVQWGLAPPIEALAWRRVRAAGIPVVYTVHNVLPHERHAGQPAAWRTLYRAVDRLIVHSEAARRRLVDLVGGDPDRVAVVPMAADPVGPLPDRAAARRSLGIPEEARLALFFGHVRPYKGLDRLLAAWPEIRSTVPGATLLVAGPVAGGPSGRQRLHRRIERLGIAASVSLRPGYVPTEQVDALFAAADVVALPYRDTDDSAVLEAARARGRAVVATAVGGLREALAAGGGLVVPPGDTASLAAALARVLADRELRARLEAEALDAARSRTWSDVARETVMVYRAAGARV